MASCCFIVLTLLLGCLGAFGQVPRQLGDSEEALLATLVPVLKARQVDARLQQAFTDTLRAALVRLDDAAYDTFLINASALHERLDAFLEALAGGALQISNIDERHVNFWVYAVITSQTKRSDSSGEEQAIATARALGERVFAPALSRAIEALPEEQRERWRGELIDMPDKLTEDLIGYLRRCQDVRLFPAFRRGVSPERYDKIAAQLIEHTPVPIYGALDILMRSADETYRDALRNYVAAVGVSVRVEMLIQTLYPECLEVPWLPVDGLGTLSSDADGLPLVGLKLKQEQELLR